MVRKLSWIIGLLGIIGLGAGFTLRTYPTYTTHAWLALIGGAVLFIAFLVYNRIAIAGMFAGRRAKYGTNTAVMISITAALVVLVQLLAMRHNSRADLTRNKRHSLAPQSIKITTSLPHPMKAYFFSYMGETDFETAEKLLERYAAAGENFSYEVVDPNLKPRLTKQFEIKQLGTTVLEYQGKTKKVTQTDEQEITNAMINLLREEKKVVYVMTGHGEAMVGITDDNGISTAREALQKENYEVRELLLMREPGVPEDCDVLVMAGPTADLHETELTALTNYLNSGGSLMLLADFGTPAQLDEYSKSFGFQIGSFPVVDILTQMYGGDPMAPLVVAFGRHPITDGFNLNPMLPIVRSVNKYDSAGDRVTVDELMFTSDNSWVETGVTVTPDGQIKLPDESAEVTFDEITDTLGPISVAAASTIALVDSRDMPADETGEAIEEREARIVVVGDVDFIRNAFFKINGNDDMFLNMIGWLLEDENLIAIRPREADMQPLIMTPVQGKVLFWLPILILPALVAGFGFMTISQRRRYR
ncbi:GldG family protein [bacterium]|nr:GldG family protein [candidate division CSSED10-310 bacterium]